MKTYSESKSRLSLIFQINNNDEESAIGWVDKIENLLNGHETKKYKMHIYSQA